MNKTKGNLSASIGVRLTPELRVKLSKLSDRLGMKPSEVIRLCVDSQLEEIQKTGEFRLNLKDE
jgi:predicted DNA-binding protein